MNKIKLKGYRKIIRISMFGLLGNLLPIHVTKPIYASVGKLI